MCGLLRCLWQKGWRMQSINCCKIHFRSQNTNIGLYYWMLSLQLTSARPPSKFIKSLRFLYLSGKFYIIPKFQSGLTGAEIQRTGSILTHVWNFMIDKHKYKFISCIVIDKILYSSSKNVCYMLSYRFVTVTILLLHKQRRQSPKRQPSQPRRSKHPLWSYTLFVIIFLHTLCISCTPYLQSSKVPQIFVYSDHRILYTPFAYTQFEKLGAADKARVMEYVLCGP